MRKTKPIVYLLLMLTLVFALAACSAGTPSSPDSNPAGQDAADAGDAVPDGSAAPSPDAQAGGDILVAYFSHTGNTEAVAQQIASLTGGTLAQIGRAEDYGDLQQEAEAEIKDGARPEITVSVDNVADYDTVFVGYPIWWDEAPAMIATFLSSYDFSGKTIVPFVTSGGSGFSGALDTIAELQPDAAVLDGLRISGSSAADAQAEVTSWLADLGFTE